MRYKLIQFIYYVTMVALFSLYKLELAKISLAIFLLLTVVQIDAHQYLKSTEVCAKNKCTL